MYQIKSSALNWVALSTWLDVAICQRVSWDWRVGGGSAPHVPHAPWNCRLVDACSSHGDGRGASWGAQTLKSLASLLSLLLTFRRAKQIIWPSHRRRRGLCSSILPLFSLPPSSSSSPSPSMSPSSSLLSNLRGKTPCF